MNNIQQRLEEFFAEITSELHRVSRLNEGILAFMPDWLTSNVNVRWGVTEDNHLVAIRIEPDEMLEKNIYKNYPLQNPDQGNRIIAPLSINYWDSIKQYGTEEPIWLEGSFVRFVKNDNPLDYKQTALNGVSCICEVENMQRYFSAEGAQLFVGDSWKVAQKQALNDDLSYAEKLRSVISTLRFLIKTTAFKELRLHRYINYHREYLLPPHEKCYFEQPIYLDDPKKMKYKADFILNMGVGRRALLIELENAQHEMYTKGDDLRAGISHASNQVSKWSKAINKYPQNNGVLTDEFSFLGGLKDRLVIAGTGTKHRDKLNDTKEDDTTVLTYDLLIDDAIARLNKKYDADCEMFGVQSKHRRPSPSVRIDAASHREISYN